MSDPKSPAERLLDKADGHSSKNAPVPQPPPSISGSSTVNKAVKEKSTLQSTLQSTLPSNRGEKDKVWKNIVGSESATGADLTIKTKWEHMKITALKALKTKGVVALIVFVLVAAVMAAVNPPIVQKPQEDDSKKPKRSMVRILIWALVAGVLALVIPVCISWANKRNSKASKTVSGS